MYEETDLKISDPKLCGLKGRSNGEGSRYMVLFYETDQYEEFAFVIWDG